MKEIDTKLTLKTVRYVTYELLLLITCIYCDSFVGSSSHFSKLGENGKFLKAAVDSFTHGFIAFLSWGIVVDLTLSVPDLIECSMCMLLGMILDIDHFIAAGSLSLKEAISLHSRPFFHASSVIIVIAVGLTVVSVIKTDFRYTRFAALFTVAWTSHHIRDGTRRGLWFPPFGSTGKLSQTTYIGSIMILPLVLRIVFIYAKDTIHDKKNNSILIHSKLIV